MPQSQQPKEGEQIILDEIRATPEVAVLDVGAGEGKWGDALFDDVDVIDGVEAWEPYVDKYLLKAKYDNLYVADIKDFKDIGHYDVMILGDVFEHLEYDDAIKFIEYIKEKKIPRIYLTLPISLCVQDGMCYGNPYETHRYQWKHEELVELGFKQLHEGFNDNGLVKIGTYIMKNE